MLWKMTGLWAWIVLGDPSSGRTHWETLAKAHWRPDDDLNHRRDSWAVEDSAGVGYEKTAEREPGGCPDEAGVLCNAVGRQVSSN